jgi:ribosome-associated protein|tara:strand:+ start:204 stop:578 length:375 start_codon:yes stop_codon:yes gene_type:complete
LTVIDSNITDLVVDALDDLKAVDTKIVDVRGLSSVMDFLVIASGNSSRHIKSLADNVVVKAKAAGCPPIGVEGENAADWVLVDLGDVVVHVMQPAARSFYDLERLWSGEPEVSTQQDVVADHWA